MRACSQTTKNIVQAVQEKFTAKTSRGISTPKATGFAWLAREGGAPCERVPVFRWNSQADLTLVSATNGSHDTTPQQVFMISTEFEEAIFPISNWLAPGLDNQNLQFWLDFLGVMKLNYRWFQTNNTLIMKSPQILKASLTRLASATWDPERMVGERSLETQVAVKKSGENSGIFQRPKDG